MTTLSLLGAGALLAWLGLPLLWLAARRGPEVAPASRYRALLLALVFATTLFAVPALRSSRFALAAEIAASGVLTPTGTSESQTLAIARKAAPPLALAGLVWLFLSFVGLARLCARTAYAGWLARGRTEVPPPLLERSELLARELGIPPPRLIVSSRAALPFAVAFPATAVVLPEPMLRALEEEKLTLVLRHELTHLARADHLAAVLVELLKVPFAFHPLAARLCRELGLAREMAVDARLGAVAPRAYAHLLVDVAELHRFGPREAGEVALEPTSLERRIDMLTRPLPHRAARLAPVLLLALGLFGADESPDRYEELHLAVGAVKVITVVGTQRIAIGDPDVADVMPLGKDGSEIQIKGVAKGMTTVLVWTAAKRLEYKIVVE